MKRIVKVKYSDWFIDKWFGLGLQIYSGRDLNVLHFVWQTNWHHGDREDVKIQKWTFSCIVEQVELYGLVVVFSHILEVTV